MKNFVYLILLSLLFSCASYQPGKYADIVSGDHPADTPITAEVDKQLTTENYTFINFSFGNLGDDWRRVKSVRIDFNNKDLNKKASLIVGDDLQTWSSAIQHKLAIDRYNRDVFWGSIALVGATAAIASGRSGNSSGMAAGSLAYTTSLGIMGANSFIDQISDLERASLFPATHLYQPFSIPAGLYSNRWVLLQIKKEDMPRIIYFNVEYLDGKKAYYQIDLGLI